MAKRTRRGQKQCPKCKAWIKGTRAKSVPQVRLRIPWRNDGCLNRHRSQQPEKAGDTVTISQVKAVAQTVKTVGGFVRLNELLGLIKEVGGVKKFKELLEAIAAPKRTRSRC